MSKKLETLKFPSTIEEEQSMLFTAYYADFSERTIGYKSKKDANPKEKKEQLGSINIPMPNSFRMEQTHNWNNYDITDTIGDALDKVGSDTFQKYLTKIKSYSKLSTRATGLQIDPRTLVEYKGENLRTFSFVYTFIPKSKDEAENILKIIKFFRVYGSGRRDRGEKKAVSLLDSLLSESMKITNGIFISEPARWDIKFVDNDKVGEILGFQKPFVIENFSTSLFEDGYPSMFRDNMPKKITISFTMRETELMYSDDWDSGIEDS